jgi:hypothetical protein
MEVRLYTTPTAGTIVAKETFPSVKITAGKFNIKYGNNGIADKLAGTSNWVAVAVAGVELKPRVQLVTVPFALHSGDTKALKAEIHRLQEDCYDAINDVYDRLDEVDSQLKRANFRLNRVDPYYKPGEEDWNYEGPHTGWDQ